ncbi:hypothetical protein U1Q18_020488 [Sarracenia purpurea var. burkii]
MIGINGLMIREIQKRLLVGRTVPATVPAIQKPPALVSLPRKEIGGAPVEGGRCRGLTPRFGLVVGRRGWRQRFVSPLPPTGFVFSPSMESLANLHERSSSGTD